MNLEIRLLPQARKIGRTSTKKRMFFGMSILKSFLVDFNDFGAILGGSGVPKKCQKSKKIVLGARLECNRDFRTILESILERICNDFGKFGMDFRMIFEEI